MRDNVANTLGRTEIAVSDQQKQEIGVGDYPGGVLLIY